MVVVVMRWRGMLLVKGRLLLTLLFKLVLVLERFGNRFHKGFQGSFKLALTPVEHDQGFERCS